ncbi:protein of unknown function [Petrocella atlantisensis]|uniref:Uncharacterized protein n=1 Tax=Petrocella atlantisensis TaxID=2173034 RepID=A0A3P7PAB6_9FIRM|nr:protein of unknown function [Petrocella atlantisensis]
MINARVVSFLDKAFIKIKTELEGNIKVNVVRWLSFNHCGKIKILIRHID